ncbi:outer membrane beta-barrel protein [Spirosoma sp.]|uniref:outer membrane beta-barrel protein n=1 Tax=Spirosoma sp. TaxID=1899569 RepID=UPI00260425F8|nr:outer membrane beta-barrel protein [Spirosoma sp.]MCX6218217.1 outer membrane beta-barrel protein [Spirosoma sp.]
MKALLCTCLILLTNLTITSAQTEKGRWTAGATVGNLTYSKKDTYSSFAASLMPSAGYFVVNNLEAGTGVPLSINTSKYASYNGDARNSGTSIGLSPYVRYYIGSSKLKPFIGLAYGYSWTSIRNRDSGQDIKGKGFTSTLTPTVGVAYFINRSVALNASLNYISQKYKTAYANYNSGGTQIEVPVSTTNYMSLGIGFQIFLGQ